jgi:hypothetical protein
MIISPLKSELSSLALAALAGVAGFALARMIGRRGGTRSARTPSRMLSIMSEAPSSRMYESGAGLKRHGDKHDAVFRSPRRFVPKPDAPTYPEG